MVAASKAQKGHDANREEFTFYRDIIAVGCENEVLDQLKIDLGEYLCFVMRNRSLKGMGLLIEGDIDGATTCGDSAAIRVWITVSYNNGYVLDVPGLTSKFQLKEGSR